MIRKLLLSTVAIAALSSSAFAADLPSRRAPPVYAPPPAPLFTWTGFYLGAQVGYAFGRDGVYNYDPRGVGPSNFFVLGNPNGIIGGVHGGYNFSTQSLPVIGQFAGAFSSLPFIGGFGGAGGVVGIEGDVDGTDYRSAQTIGAFTGTSRNDIQGSIRGRVGIAVDRALFYATGGAAFAEFRNTYFGGVGPFYNNSHTRIGYTVGGGIEYAITTQFSLRAEYRYTDFGNYSDFTGPFGAALAPTVFRNHVEQQRVQVGFSYKFDTPPAAPVVARY